MIPVICKCKEEYHECGKDLGACEKCHGSISLKEEVGGGTNGNWLGKSPIEKTTPLKEEVKWWRCECGGEITTDGDKWLCTDCFKEAIPPTEKSWEEEFEKLNYFFGRKSYYEKTRNWISTKKEQWEEAAKEEILNNAEKYNKEIFKNLKNEWESEVKQELIKKIEGEKVEEGEAMYADDPDGKMSEGYTDGYNSALDEIMNFLSKE